MTMLTKQPLSLFHFDTNLLDTSGKVWTQIGNPVVSSSNAVFGGGSLKLTPSDGLSLLNHNLDVGEDFTVSWREYLISTPTNSGGGIAINYGYTAGDNYTSGLLLGHNYGGYKAILCGSGVNATWDLIKFYNICSYNDVLGKWVHYEVSYKKLNGVLRVFKDGQLINTWTGIILYNGNKKPADKIIKIGYHYNNGQNCYIDEVLITQECLHTTNFTPPTSAYEVSLPYWLAKAKSQVDNNVKSLLHFDTNLTNSKNRNFDIIGNPQISTTQSKFGKSLYLDGNSYLSTPITSDLNLSTGDFTIEWWEYRTSLTDHQVVLSFDDGKNGDYDFIVGSHLSGAITVFASSNGTSWNILNGFSLGTAETNKWCHFALVRSGNTFYGFKNGANISSITSSSSIYFNNLTNINLGTRLTSLRDVKFNGYIDELRISKGIARYTSNFTPPTIPFVEDANTSLLLHFDEEFTNFYKDEVGRTWTTTVGTPKLLTSNYKFGSKSLYLDGNSRVVSDIADIDISSGDFTIEWWEYSTISNNSAIFALYTEDTADTKGLVITNASDGFRRIYISSNGTSWNIIGSNSTNNLNHSPINTWQHFAIVRGAGNISIFQNGILVKSINILNTVSIFKGTTLLKLGIHNYQTSYFHKYTGYIDELRISKGIARYTANFTPPTAPFSLNSANSYYSYKTNSWVDVGLPTTDAEIVTLFQNYGTDTCPTQQQLELLGTGVNRPNRCCYQPVVTTQPTININAVPTGKTVKPVELLPISSIEGIDSVSIANTISGTPTVKLAVTLDLVTYYRFNGTTWEVIDINTNQDNMMDIATVTSINRSQWDLLTNGTASGIAFAYYLDISGIGDTVKIDKTSLVVDMKGEWDSAIKGTDFKYGYPANDRLKVTLLTTGNYKINYVGG